MLVFLFALVRGTSNEKVKNHSSKREVKIIVKVIFFLLRIGSWRTNRKSNKTTSPRFVSPHTEMILSVGVPTHRNKRHHHPSLLQKSPQG
jgi:hypothetical protein